jgi:hypothetical protein
MTKRADPGKGIVGITVGIDGFSHIKCDDKSIV